MKFKLLITLLFFIIQSNINAQDLKIYYFDDLDNFSKTVDDNGVCTYRVNENKIISGQFVNGKKSGKWKSFYPGKGTLHHVVEFVNDSLHGKYIEYSSHKKIKISANFVNGVLNGEFAYNSDIGKPIWNGFFKNNLKEGVWIQFDNNGFKKQSIQYVAGQVNGKVIEYGAQNKPLQVSQYKNNKLNGQFTSYDPYHTNKIFESGNYHMNTKIGIWREFHLNGKIAIESNYNTIGKLDGPKIEFYYDGDTASVEYYANDKPIKTWKSYWRNHKLKKEIHFNAENKPDGLYMEYFSNEKPSVIGHYKNGDKTGKWQSYYVNEMVYSAGHYVDNQQEGNWKYFHENGKISSEGNFDKDKKVGQWFDFHTNGKLLCIGEYDQDGEKTGLWGYFYKSGKLQKEEQWSKGKLLSVDKLLTSRGKDLEIGSLKDGDGTLNNYDEKGNLVSIGSFVDGYLDGPWLEYHNNKAIAIEGHMSNGKKEGVWKYYDKIGSLVQEKEFRNDEEIKTTSYSPYGQNEIYMNEPSSLF
ncbi:toxin-antitoxin system YwqK family antitoxin [Aureibacter tunicatorum]|uniref:Antitoxin component YwqK of YwqJK toxin-antitoxin module n=1 Tax=Aureibacter tunicatorum TaxID=866807 RepID=A0AAE3XNK0_9BACT|nr:hypothetical protein [Aureibacter tunicatorum]MDR6239174.1 antitoxin component YwqK of YwqJK toxin-antitoxin module [Aureibacter tunicatorum]BDD04900.1 hypothetical protein AUTU_23830 [Aureibacter tunicatorum]